MKETKILEFKSTITNTFLKTVSAFANFGEGSIIFGISDQGEIIGFTDPIQECLNIENKINDNISPKPDYQLEVHPKDKTITLTVYEGDFKPYLYRGKAYRRADSSTLEVDSIELKRLVLEGSHLNYEELINNNQSLTFDVLGNEFKNKLCIKEFNSDILRTLDLQNKDGIYNNAAALLADQNDFYGIDLAKFGDNISEIFDRETLSNQSIISQYLKSMEMFKRYYEIEVIEGFERKNKELIPESAFREAIANALIHRTWDLNCHIKVAMYPDYIEVISPGGLPKGISEEEYLRGNLSVFRNPLIGNVFYRLKYIEMFGTGIQRIKAAYRDYEVKPIFEVYENSIKVILPAIHSKRVMNEKEDKIYSVLSSNSMLSTSDIMKLTNYKKATTIRTLNSLLEKKYIRQVGNGRGTKYLL